MKISARKRRLIRVLDAVLRPIVAGWERLWRSPSGVDSQISKILVMEYWNLGDIVMLSPFLRSLRIQYPDAHITLLTSPKCASLVERQELADEIIHARMPWAQHYSRWRKYNPFSLLWLEVLRTLKTLRAQRFDLAFTARADIRENATLWIVQVARRVGYGFGGGGFFLTDVVTPDLQHPHFSNRWLRLLEHLGKRALVRHPRLHVTPEEEQFATQTLEDRGIQQGEFLIGIHPGARSLVRQWGEENFSALSKRMEAQFPVKIVWFQDPKQGSSIPESNQPQPLSLPLREFMAVLGKCQLFICNDSGPMHIATALGVPVVAVFGPTEPTWFGPIGEENHIVIQAGFMCRPCFDYCIFDQPYCLRGISVDAVFETSAQAVNSLLHKASQGAIGNESTLHAAEGKKNNG